MIVVVHFVINKYTTLTNCFDHRKIKRIWPFPRAGSYRLVSNSYSWTTRTRTSDFTHLFIAASEAGGARWTQRLDHLTFLASISARSSRSAGSHSTKAIKGTAYQRVIIKERKKRWRTVFHPDHTRLLCTVMPKKPKTSYRLRCIHRPSSFI